MPEDASQVTCTEFQNQLAELLSSGVNVEDHPHAKACAICRQMLLDLETIAEAARYRRFGSDNWSEST
jgi:hypothetical protein